MGRPGASRRQLESGTIAARLEVRDKIRFWKGDADLVGIRDADCLDKLPPDERQECRALWAAVDVFIKNASAERQRGR